MHGQGDLRAGRHGGRQSERERKEGKGRGPTSPDIWQVITSRDCDCTHLERFSGANIRMPPKEGKDDHFSGDGIRIKTGDMYLS